MIDKTKEMVDDAIRTRNIGFLCEYYFGVELTPKQREIVKAIVWPDNKRIVISCMTRYGKSFVVSMAILLYIAFHGNKRNLIIAPTIDQSKIIRNYMSNFIINSDQFSDLIDINLTGLDRLKSEVSKKRITFKNGSELMILSAEGSAERLMGFGADGLVVMDESCLIEYEVYRQKISRMLGDSPESILVEIGNPWNRNNQMYEHWINPKFKKIHIGYKDALKEHRLTQEHLDEQKELLTPMEFEVLYEANFPEEAEDSIFTYKKVQAASLKEIKPSEGKVKRIISCDVADKGKDKTVIMWGYEDDGYYVVEDIWTENKSENMAIAGKIVNLYEEKGADYINIDTIGVGVGVVSRVKELLGGKTTIKACHYGEGVGTSGKESKPRTDESLADRKSDSGRKRFMNRKAEQYFRLNDLFNEGLITIPKNEHLIKELMKMGWEVSSSGKIKIIDPEDKSPDYADALVYFIWKTKEEIVFDFGGKK